MSRLSKQDAEEILHHIQEIGAILDQYKKEQEPYDQVDYISARAKEIAENIRDY